MDFPNDVETIFLWKPERSPPLNSPEDIISIISNKMKECDGNYDEEWTKIIFKSILSYENVRKYEYQNALNEINECLNILQESTNEFVSMYKDGLQYTLMASRKCILTIMDPAATTEDFQPFADLDNANKSVVYGLRSAVYFEYGPINWQIALEFATKAKDLACEEPEWHFLKGKAYFRKRRFESKEAEPSPEELECLERAAEYSHQNQPQYKVLLAETYRNAAKYNQQRKQTAIEFNRKAKENFDEAYKNAGRCGNTYARCANGFMKLHGEFKDNQKAKVCIERALEFSGSNAVANHIAGQYYEFVENNYEEAEKYYVIAKDQHVYEAYLGWINLKIKMDPSYDPTSDYEHMLTYFLEPKEQIYINCVLGYNFLIMGNRQHDVIKHWHSAVNISSDCSLLQNVSLFYKERWYKLNILQMLFNETLAIMTQYEGILRSIESKYPEVNKKDSIPDHQNMEVTRSRERTRQQRSKSQGVSQLQTFSGSMTRSSSQAPTGKGSWRKREQK